MWAARKELKMIFFQNNFIEVLLAKMTGDKEYEFGKKVTLLNNPLTKEKN